MENGENFGYFSKYVADKVGVAKDTLRTWCLRLEAEGVIFERNHRDQRIYYEKDIRALSNMKELMDLQQPLNDVAKIIAAKYKNGEYEAIQTVEPEKTEEKTLTVFERTNELSTQEERLEQFKQELLTEFSEEQRIVLEEFQKKIMLEMTAAMQDRFEEAVRQAVKNTMLQKELKQELSESIAKEVHRLNQEVAATRENGSFWSKLFGKKK